MSPETKLSFQISTKITFRDSGEFSVGKGVRRESVVRSSEKALLLANRLAVGSVLVVLVSRVADRSECGNDGLAWRTGYRPEWSSSAGMRRWLHGTSRPAWSNLPRPTIRDFTGFR